MSIDLQGLTPLAINCRPVGPTSVQQSTRVRTAFTLVELVIVVLLIGILSAGAAPKLARTLRDAQADGAARRVKADLDLARETAISRSTTQSVQFTANSPVYTLPGISDPDHPAKTYSVDLSVGTYEARVIAATFGGSSTVQFDRYGQPSAGGGVTIFAGGLTKTITVEATSGVVIAP